MTNRGLEEQKADGIRHDDFKGFHFFAVTNVDVKCLNVIVQVLSAIHSAQIETAGYALDLENGIVFFNTGYICK